MNGNAAAAPPDGDLRGRAAAKGGGGAKQDALARARKAADRTARTRAAPEPERAPRVHRFGPFSTVARRIIAINLVGLALLVGGVLYLNQFRDGLIDLRIQSLETQGEIIAITVAEAAGAGAMATRYDPVRANLVLRRLIQPIGVRAQVYDRAGRLTGDTRSLLSTQRRIETQNLRPPMPDGPEGLLERIEIIYGRIARMVRTRPPLYRETPVAGVARDAEVYSALRGGVASAVRANSQGELIVSVAVPVQRFKAVMGALVLSTKGGDIDAVVSNERIQILQVFLVALAVSLTLSVVLAGTIARPIRKLAEAAERGGVSQGGRIGAKRIRIPDFTSRSDEIGHLSGALRGMTDALYNRIDAIESFAADVAHEIKNPLTSLRSAVETMRLAKTPTAQERLLIVIENDVRRMDRLVTDISNASRLDAELAREEMTRFDMGDLIETVADIARSRASTGDTPVQVSLPPTPLMVTGLEGRIAQVIQNLISNAASFTPENGSVRVLAEPRKNGGARVTVEDDGPGVPEDNLASIFKRFYTERPAGEEFGSHSGLGLSIAKQIVDTHDGRIWAENRRAPDASVDTPPLGARFIVELPR